MDPMNCKRNKNIVVHYVTQEAPFEVPRSSGFRGSFQLIMFIKAMHPVYGADRIE